MHVLESVKNLFNFSVPLLSWLAFVVLFIITIVLYFVSLRFVIKLKFQINILVKVPFDALGDKPVFNQALDWKQVKVGMLYIQGARR